MIHITSISSRSLSCASLCAVLVFIYGGFMGAVHTPKTAQASVSTSNFMPNRTALRSSENSPLYSVIGTNTIPANLAIASSKNRRVHSFSKAALVGSSTDTKQQKTPKEIHKSAQSRAQYTDGSTPVMTKRDKREILWLARIIYSETKRPHEQRLVAWVVRNRVDTGYRGRSYEAVANSSDQFSGLQPSNPRYEHNMTRWWASNGESWQTALDIAQEVYFAPESQRPFSVTTRHFYSPVAVDKPAWARGREAVRVVRSVHHNEPRFAFYARVR